MSIDSGDESPSNRIELVNSRTNSFIFFWERKEKDLFRDREEDMVV